MDNLSHPLAATLRWLAVLWLVGWTLYATVWDDSSAFYLRNTMFELGALLIPAVLAFGVASQVDGFPNKDPGHRTH